MVVDGSRDVILPSTRKECNMLAHQFHENIKDMLNDTRWIWWWTWMAKKLEEVLANCNTSLEIRRRKLPTPPVQNYTPVELHPLDVVNIDYFQKGQFYYILIVDRSSQFAFCSET